MQIIKDLLTQKGFTNDQVEILTQHFSISKKLAEGDFFLKEGQTSQFIALIVTGQCRYFYHTEKGEVTRWVSLEGDFMTSLSSFIQEKPSLENIQAIKDCFLVMVSRPSWNSLYTNHSFVRQFWAKTMESNYIGMEDRVYNLIALDAEQRYRWMLDNYPRINNEAPDKYIASMLGITPRHLSRIRAMKN